jgi:hypothetical protein
MNNLKDPFQTTVPNVGKHLPRTSPEFIRMIRRIQDKVMTYGLCSDSEQRILNQINQHISNGQN